MNNVLTKKKQDVDVSYGVIAVRKDTNEWLSTLLIQGRYGNWGIPKGHAMNGEDDLAAARREFIEETGIKQFEIITTPKFLQEYRIELKGQIIEKTVTYFLAKTQSIDVVLPKDEILDSKWLSFKDAISFATHDGTKKVLQDVEDYITNNPKLFL